jgi:pyrroline-5-carboxylate reductase
MIENMSLQDTTVAFIGAGVMGEAMIKGLLHKALISQHRVIAADPHQDRLQELKQHYDIKTTMQNAEAVADADIVVLSVKPQVLSKVAGDLTNLIHTNAMILSIVAGVSIASIEQQLGNQQIIRAMPNTPGQIGQGITVWTASSSVTTQQREQAQLMLGALGDDIYVNDEHDIDMATALNGTGPAYVFMFMEALIDAGVHLGFSRRESERLVLQTMRGSVEYALQSGVHPAQLRNQVTSPGGTSAAAIYELEKGGIRTVIADAVWAAYRRAVELGKAQENTNK